MRPGHTKGGGAAITKKLREAPPPRPGCGRETLTTSGVCGEEMRPPQERAANENRMEFREPRRNTGKGYSCVHGKVIIICAEVKHSGGSAFHLFCLGACEGGGAGGSSGGPGGSCFPEGSQGHRGAVGGRQEPAAIFVLFLQCPGSHLAKGRLSLGLSEATIHLHKSQDRWRGEGMRGPGP